VTDSADDAPAKAKCRVTTIRLRGPVESLVEYARSGRRHFALSLIKDAVHDLRAGVPLAPVVAQYLADALEKIAADPSRAAEALGIKPRRGAPRRMAAHYEMLGRIVTQYHDSGIPLKDGRPCANWDGNGAYTMTVERCRRDGVKATDSQVRRGYEAYQKKLQAKRARFIALNGTRSLKAIATTLPHPAAGMPADPADEGQ